MDSISINYTLVWQLSYDNKYQWSKCGKCFNVKTGRELKKVYQSGCVGYNINSKFKSLTFLKKNLVKINKVKLPF